MRWIYFAVIILFAAATIIFAVQNFEIVTMSFLGISTRPCRIMVRPDELETARAIVASATESF